MAHDWLRELFLRWGRKPTRRAARPRFGVERLEGRVVPSAYPILAPEPAAGQSTGFVPGPNLAPTQTEIVVAVEGADPAGTLARLGAAQPGVNAAAATVVLAMDGRTTFSVPLAPGADPAAVSRWFAAQPGVGYAQPNYRSLVDARRFTPNDPLFSQQFFHPPINTEQAWNTTTGSKGIIVAIADDGLSVNHPDLRDNIWINPGEIAGDNLDNDANGFVDDINGYDFAANKSSPQPQNANSTHGTHVGGLVAARADNALGVAGVAGGRGTGAPGNPLDPNTGVRLMGLRWDDAGDKGRGYNSVNIARALRYAVDNGAKIINASYDLDLFVDGAGTIDPLIRDAVNYLYRSPTGKETLFFYASGNENAADVSGKAYTQFLTVAATNKVDRKASYSNFGRFIDISAPGGDFPQNTEGDLSTVFPDAYEFFVGTSMATPVAAGVAALIWSAHPTWTRDQVAAQLLGTADRIDGINPTFDSLLGAGRVNAGRGVTETLAAPTFGKTIGLPAAGATAQVVTRFEVVTPFRFDPASVTPAAFELRGAGADSAFGTPDDLLVPLTVNSGLPYRIGTDSFVFDFPALPAGKFRFTAAGGAAGLKDPFGTPFDGNADGAAGGDFVREFTAAPPLSGVVYESRSGLAAPTAADVGVAGQPVYIDRNSNSKFDGGEPFTVTGFGGRFVFAGIAPGSYSVALAPTPGFVLAPGAAAALPAVLAAGGSVGGLNFPVRRPGAVYGSVFVDADGDGGRGPAEGGLAGVQVLLDANNNGLLDASTKTAASTFNSAGPVTFADNSSAVSPITVASATGRVTNVQVVVNASQEFNIRDFLNLTLRGPDGTRVMLANFVPSFQNSANTYTNTKFESKASNTSILLAGPTATGTFRPVDDLAQFNGRSAVGEWGLIGTATRAGSGGGTISSWQLLLTTSDGEQIVVTDGTGGYRFDTAPGTFNLVLPRVQGRRLTTPGAGVGRTAYTYPVAPAAGAAGGTVVTGLQDDAVAPTLVGITPVGPGVTNSKTVDFRVEFSEPVDGVTAGSFGLSQTGFATLASISNLVATADPRVFVLTVATPGVSGTVAVTLPAGPLADFALNPLAGTPAVGETVTVDTAPPDSGLGIRPSPSGSTVYTTGPGANFPGEVGGNFGDVGTGVLDIQVSIQQEGTGFFFDGSSFASPTPVQVSARLDAVNRTWTLAVPANTVTEGRYSVVQTAIDFAGNAQVRPNDLVFSIDNGPPTAEVSPASGTLVNANPIPFVVSFNEPVVGSLNRDRLSVTGGTISEVTGSGSSFTVRVVPAGSGPVTLTVAAGAATDFGGNPSGAASTTVMFDNNAPDVVVFGGLDGAFLRSSAFPGGLTGTAGDAGTGITRVAVAVRRAGTDRFFDGTAFTSSELVYLPATGTTNFSFAFPAELFAGDDLYQFLVQATDAAGNQFVTPLAVTIDDTAPVPAIASPASGGLVTAAQFEQDGRRISGTATDATAGPADTTVAVQRASDGAFFDGTGFVQSAAPIFVPAAGTPGAFGLPALSADRLADGQYIVTARTVDRAGNVGTASTTFVFDSSAPQPLFLTPADGSGFNAAGFPGGFGGTVADDGDTSDVRVTLRRLADGLYWNGSFFGSPTPVLLATTVTDNGGTVRPPIQRLTLPPGASFFYPFSANGFPAEGLYQFTAIATDKAGGVGQATSTFSFDNSAPTARYSFDTGPGPFSTRTVPNPLAIIAADTLSGVAGVGVSLRQVSTGRYFDGGGFNSPTEVRLPADPSGPAGSSLFEFRLPDGALTSDGQYVYNVYAADRAGNVQAFGTPYSFTVDGSAPQAFVSAGAGAVTNVAPLVFTVSFSTPVRDLDVAGLAVQNGTVLSVTRQSDTLFVVRVTPTADGPVALAVTPAAATDFAGNPTLPAGPAVGQFDRTAPTVTLRAPGGAVPQGQPVTLTAVFSEPVVGFGASSLRVTNGIVQSLTGDGTTFQIQVLPAGPGGVTVSVPPGAFADAAGNAGAASAEVGRTSEDPRFAVAVGSSVRTYDARNGVRSQTAPFGDGYTGTIRVASADFNADGIPDTVVGTGPGGASDVRILDGVTGVVLYQVNPFEEQFTGGVFVAAGDLTGDGVADLVVSPDVGGGPRIRIFDGKTFGQMADFFGIEDSAFRGGARTAVGDVNGDGVADLVVAAGVGGGPRVAVFSGQSVTSGAGNLVRVVGDFFAYEQTLRNGVFVAAGDLDGDGKAELVTAGGPGGGPRVTVFGGAALTNGSLSPQADFFAGDPNSRGGARVAVKRMTVGGDGELIVGDGSSNVLSVYTAAGLRASPPAASFRQDLLPGLDVGGVFVG